VASSRRRPQQGDRVSAAGDWVADFNHAGTALEEAWAELHEARFIARVQPVDDVTSVALTSGFFAEDSRQQEHLLLDVQHAFPPNDPYYAGFTNLTCSAVLSGFAASNPCATPPGVILKPLQADSSHGVCRVELERNGAVDPLEFGCVERCDDKMYVEDPGAFCSNIHFMTPVKAVWTDPGDVWMCASCACDDPSEPGTTITAPVQGCAQAGLDPSNPDHQAIACAEVCGGTFCGGSPACAIGECHPPASGGVAALIAPSACDPTLPPPLVRVAASGDYHATVRVFDDPNGPGSVAHYGLGDESADGAIGGELRFNVGADGPTSVIDFAQTLILPLDFSIADLDVAGVVVTTVDRPFGQFESDTAFAVPAGVGVLAVRGAVDGDAVGVNVVNPADDTGTFDLATRAFSLTFQASGGEEDAPASVSATIHGYIDNVPPEADSGGPVREVECASHTTTPVTLVGGGSSDPDPGDLITHFQWFTSLGGPVGNQVSEDVQLPYGSSFFVLHVYDLDLSAAQAPLEVDVVDKTSPTLEVTPTSFCLWPANHARVRFHLGTDFTAIATDICDPNPKVSIVGVTSDEPDDGLADGHTTGDATFGPQDLCVRRERSGIGDGRVYTVTIEARDFADNTTVKNIEVFVPHDKPNGLACSGGPTIVGDDDNCG
jgi:hypothetical protein